MRSIPVTRLVGGAARSVRTLAIAAAASALVVVLFAFRDGLPDGGAGWAGVIVLLVLVGWPAAVLFVLAGALGALAALPERVLATPAEARSRGADLAALATRVRAARGRGMLRLPFHLWRLLWLFRGARELLGPHAGALPLASVPFLALSAAAVAATMVLVPVALVLLLALLFS